MTTVGMGVLSLSTVGYYMSPQLSSMETWSFDGPRESGVLV